MTTQIKEKIINKIRLNRISTTEIADCMGKTGLLESATALNRRHHRVGGVYFTYAYNESNYELHEQLTNVPEGSVVITEEFNCNQRALYGSLVSKYLLLYSKAVAVVTNGRLRDAPRLIKENYPIWCNGVTPIGCFNTKNDAPIDASWAAERKKYYTNAIAVCDDSGVVIIPEHFQTTDFLIKLDWIETQEDAWFFCIDTLKWDTYKTVCEKAYLDDDRLKAILHLSKKDEEL